MGKTDSHEALALSVMRSSIITTFFFDIRILWAFDFVAWGPPHPICTIRGPTENRGAHTFTTLVFFPQCKMLLSRFLMFAPRGRSAGRPR